MKRSKKPIPAPIQHVAYPIHFKKESDSGKAWLVEIDDMDYWIPKSVCTLNEFKTEIAIQSWFDQQRLTAGAMFTEDRTHRLVLWRKWGNGPMAMVIGLNPSTANEQKDDATIERLKKTLAKQTFGGFYMVNLFTVISSDPEILNDEKNRQDEQRDLGIIFGYALACQEIIVAWGAFPHAKQRGAKVLEMFPDSKCFGVNKDGSPWHPQYLMYAGFKPDQLVWLYKYREHKYENNVYGKKKDRTKRKKVIEAKAAEDKGQTVLTL
jgi:hypothetical protein